MKKTLLFLSSAILFMTVSCASTSSDSEQKNSSTSISEGFIKGFDASTIDAIEEAGLEYKSKDGKKADPFVQLSENGVNCIRLRLWNDPSKEPSAYGDNTITRTVRIAKRARENGMKILLDYHFSDTWTDPEQAKCPDMWKNIDDPEEMKKAVAIFVKTTLSEMQAENVLPSYVQLGNECENGILLSNTASEKVKGTAGSQNFTEYINAAAEEVRKTDSKIKIIMHMSRGGDQWISNEFMKNCSEIDYDIIGLSYYPFFKSHKNLDDLKKNIQFIRKNGKDCMITETSFAWTCDWISGKCDTTNNQLWYYTDSGDGLCQAAVSLANLNLQTITKDGKKCINPTIANQKAAIRGIMEAADKEGALGVCYWGGDWITTSDSPLPSAMENQTFWNYDHKLLDSIEVFRD